MIKENSTINLLVHGFAGSKEELSYLEDYLTENGHNVFSVALAGHGTTKADLNTSTYVDWVKSVKVEVDRLKLDYQHINFIGFSMGGLICSHFAKFKNADKFIFINTPVYFWNMKIIFSDVINGLKAKNYKKIQRYKSAVSAVSIKSSIDFLSLLFHSKGCYENIRKPALILQCTGDESVNYKSAKYIKNKIGDSGKLILYKGGGHQIFTKHPNLRQKVCDDILDFIVTKL